MADNSEAARLPLQAGPINVARRIKCWADTVYILTQGAIATRVANSPVHIPQGDILNTMPVVYRKLYATEPRFTSATGGLCYFGRAVYAAKAHARRSGLCRFVYNMLEARQDSAVSMLSLDVTGLADKLVSSRIITIEYFGELALRFFTDSAGVLLAEDLTLDAIQTLSNKSALFVAKRDMSRVAFNEFKRSMHTGQLRIRRGKGSVGPPADDDAKTAAMGSEQQQQFALTGHTPVHVSSPSKQEAAPAVQEETPTPEEEPTKVSLPLTKQLEGVTAPAANGAHEASIIKRAINCKIEVDNILRNPTATANAASVVGLLLKHINSARDAEAYFADAAMLTPDTAAVILHNPSILEGNTGILSDAIINTLQARTAPVAAPAEVPTGVPAEAPALASV